MCLLYSSIHYVKRPGAVLDSGSTVATLVLDDPTRVVQVGTPGFLSKLQFT